MAIDPQRGPHDEEEAQGDEEGEAQGDEEGPEAKRPRLRALDRSAKSKEKRRKAEVGYSVCEIFGPPRMTARAREKGMRGGWALDHLIEDPITHKKWDLRDAKNAARVRQMIRTDSPKLLVVNPPSDEKLLQVAVDLCSFQAKCGGLFILGNPQLSRAWKHPCMAKLAVLEGVCRSTFHLCSFGLEQKDGYGAGYVANPTSIVTNSEAIAEKTCRRCDGQHRHSPAGDVPMPYPDALCDAVLEGLQIEKQGMQVNQLAGADMCDPEDVEEIRAYKEEEPEEGGGGEVSHQHLIQKARKEEIDTFLAIPVYEHVPRWEAECDEGAVLIDTTWVDTNKGSETRPDWRSRLCAREFAGSEARDDLFSPTPPLVALKLLLSELASQTSEETARRGGIKKGLVLDVKRAFLYGHARRRIYIKLPPEDRRGRFGEVVGRLLRSMYGTRDAPMIWQAEVRKAMLELGFRQSVCQPCVYFHDARGMVAITHVDDFFITGIEEDLRWFHSSIADKFEVKAQMFGPDAGDSREVVFLGRRLTWGAAGLEYEADPKHARTLLKNWDLEASRSVSTPGVGEDVAKRHYQEEGGEGEEQLHSVEAKRYRAAAALLNYLGQDRIDLSFAAKELARHMANPLSSHVVALKRVIRYLRGCPRAVQIFPWQEPPTEIVCQVDSDWAGCTKTRRSTSGGILCFGKHALLHWSRTQATVALSSGEAELNASLKGGCEILGIRALMREWGREVTYKLEIDSSACVGTLQREGSGRQKHLGVRQLWLQERVKAREIALRKIPRESNASDCLTKHWKLDALNHFEKVHFFPLRIQ